MMGHSRSFGFSLSAALTGVLALVLTAADLWGQVASRSKLTSAERREVTKLLREYGDLRGQPEEQLAVVEQLVEIGGPAIRQAYEAVVREMAPRVERYRQKFGQAAAQTVAARSAEANVMEVQQLRARMVQLWQDASILQDERRSDSDAVLTRLNELLLVDRQSVLEAHAALGTERESLLEACHAWELCVDALYQQWLQDAPESVRQEAPPPPSFEEYLDRAEELAVRLAMPMDAESRTVLATNAQLASRLDPEESAAILAMNSLRMLLGMRPCMIDLRLAAASRDHSQDMQNLSFFSHESPVPDKGSPWRRAERFGTSAGAENIAAGTASGQAAIQMWWNSPGHRANMMSDSKRVGVGRSGVHWTMMLGS